MTDLWVVVPAYQEEARIEGTLNALAAQLDREFTLLVADNGSTDATVAKVRAFAGRAPFPVEVLVELEKGVGSAIDTGFRHAIAHGATLLARTDADCLPEPGWTAAARAGMLEARGLVCGRVTARRDEHGPAGRAVFLALVAAGALFGRIRPAHRRRHGYLTPYRMHAGNNMAITAELYEAVGGMPRRPRPPTGCSSTGCAGTPPRSSAAATWWCRTPPAGSARTAWSAPPAGTWSAAPARVPPTSAEPPPGAAAARRTPTERPATARPPIPLR